MTPTAALPAPRSLFAQHREQGGAARIAAVVHEQCRAFAAAMGVMVEDLGDAPAERCSCLSSRAMYPTGPASLLVAEAGTQVKRALVSARALPAGSSKSA
jgi:hypothetical protein